MVDDRGAASDEGGHPHITLGLLTAVEADNTVTQRTMADQLGVALGLVNGYLKRCITKGWIKVRQAPANRYAYYLTPKGFREKSRLTAEYLRQSFSLFRVSREQYSGLLAECEARGFRRVACVGASELAEIACLFAVPERVEIVAIVDRDSDAPEIANIPVVAGFAELEKVDALIITDMRDPEAAYAAAARAMSANRVLVPMLLQVARSRPRPRSH